MEDLSNQINKEVQQIKSELLAKDNRIKELESQLAISDKQLALCLTEKEPVFNSRLGRVFYDLAKSFG